MSLGSIVVRLTMNTADFDTDTKRAASIARKRAKEIDSAFSKAAFAIGAALGAATALIIKNTIDAAREQAQLAAVLKSTGGVAGQTQEQLNAMADGLQQVSTFAAGNITEMQSVLLTFTKIQGDVFPKAQRAVLDMATALGMDLQAAAIQVGKALNDPVLGVTALGRAGVQFSQDQKDVIKALVETGQTAEAQTLILAELETQFGGSAEAARNTLGGALIVLKNNFNDLLEGDNGSSGVMGTTQAINDLADLLRSQEVKEGFANIINGAATATAKFAELLAGAVNLTKFIGEEIASRVAGPSREDIVRLEQRRDRLQAELDNIVVDVPAMFNVLGIGKRDEIRAKLKEVEGQIADFYENVEQMGRKQAQAAAASTGIPIVDGGTAIIRPPPGEVFGSGAGGGGGDRGAAAAREAAAAERELARARAEAYDEIQRVYKAEQEAKRQEEEAQARAKEVVDTLLADMKFELDLLGMTNLEREKAIALRWANVDAASEEGKAIAKAAEDLEKAREQIAGQDFFRNEMKGLFTDVVSGAKSAKDAIDDFFDTLRMRAIEALAERLMDKLFGQAGTSQTGAAGGGWASWLGALFGGARAGGGPMVPGKAYLVGEEGPELVMPKAAGTVLPAPTTAQVMRGGYRGGDMTFVVQGATSPRSIERIRIDRDRAQRRAVREMA